MKGPRGGNYTIVKGKKVYGKGGGSSASTGAGKKPDRYHGYAKWGQASGKEKAKTVAAYALGGYAFGPSIRRAMEPKKKNVR